MKVNSYYSRKLHSLLGVIPLGFFLVEHMLSNFAAFQGKQQFEDQISWLNGLPLVLFLEIFLIWLPLLYHGVYGLYMAFQSNINVNNYGYFRNVMFALQRVTGVITIIFVVWHFYQTRFQITLDNVAHEDLGSHMHEILTDPVFFVLYCIGIVSTTFHFSNGFWSFLASWGITVGARAQRISTYVCMAVFVIMTTLLILALTAFTNDTFAAASSIQQTISVIG